MPQASPQRRPPNRGKASFTPSQNTLAPMLNVTGKNSTANSQTFDELTLNQGNAQITTKTAGTSGSVWLALGAITHNVGSVVNYNLGGTFSSSVNAITTSTTNVNGIFGGWATYGGTDWAAKDGSANIIAYSAYTVVAIPGKQFILQGNRTGFPWRESFEMFKSKSCIGSYI